MDQRIEKELGRIGNREIEMQHFHHKATLTDECERYDEEHIDVQVLGIPEIGLQL